MKLKSLEIAGFKSFANKTTISFTDGLTAIVGPNGSGKSNVIEAIRWVLGEQSSKTLRGTKMSDVIFSGSSTHNPVNRAEVKLTLDNSDQYINSPYSEIIITRRLYRSGESQYLINNSECRLKDINNLFMDTGMGLGSFSIISQGSVEDIFNSKPEDRRSIIETAAGVYKYKQQKHDANLKLQQTHENLDRVEDIIFELKDRNDQLKEQSSTAVKYLDLKKELKQYDISRIALELNSLGVEFNATEKIIEEEEQNAKNISNDLDVLSNQKKSLNTQLSELLSKKEQQQDSLLTYTKKIEQLSGQQNLSKQEIEFKKSSLVEHKDSLEKLKAQLSNLEKKEKEINAEIEKVNSEIAIINEKLSSLDEENINKSISDKREEYESLRGEYVAIMQKIANVNNERTYLEKTQKQADAQSDTNRQKIAGINDEINQLEDNLSSLDHEYQINLAKYEDSKKIVDKYHKEQVQLKTDAARIQDDWYKALERNQSIKIKYNSLNNLQNDHSNFFKGAQSVLNNKNQLSGVLGSVSDFIKVPSEYTKAIETALGNQLQQIVVANNQAARNAVKFLNDNRLGRATFLPINEISRRNVNNNVLAACQQNNGFVGIGNQLVSIDPKLDAVTAHLLGNLIVTKDLSSATQLSNQIRHSNRIVTLNGEVVNAGGSITGGTNKKQFDGVLTQKNNLVELEKEFSKGKEIAEGLEKQLNEAQAKLQSINDEMEQYYQQQRDAAGLVDISKNKVSFAKDTLERKQRELKAVKLSIGGLFEDDIEEKKKQNEKLKEQLNLDLLNNQSQSRDVSEKIETLEKMKESNVSEIQSTREKLIVQKEKLSNFRDQKANLIEDFDRLGSEIDDEKDIIDELNEAISNNMLSANQDGEIKKVNENIQKTQDDLEKCKSEIDEHQESIKEIEEKVDKLSKDSISQQNYLNKQVNKFDQLKGQLVNLKQQLVGKYEVDIKDIDDIVIDDSVENIKNRIAQLKREIDSLGIVNVSAIDEYKEVSKRYEFLVQQSDDLKNSSQQLTDTMNKIDVTVEKKFSETFEAIAYQFSKVYNEIFGGGKAKLVLTDPNDLLTTGIEIMAQPPGKKYRHMSLLSGGEKALTAIALLFAVLKVKPVPFSILDEAESALDAENVDRYAHYMTKLDDGTQFIVITHRKETMVYANTLYGVTMQNSGVSKVVTANLNKYNASEE
ncbi:chromosome segregation protein SMC [Apilactobacillus apinorum]|uniref:chromosome segregation protein SMC n=1 Tax=Apilactobacillus apinorum TaxID=1218495 RepID=UPI0006B606A0|nr:chromosome segregation protein SMC [Apilactobacillus apinorum]KOY68830.1 Chromosome partition protein Smc [Apilactobacillus apinorum]CAI2667037.1 smc Chromosome partition protein Smc [Apilactobacillus apinorum]